MIKFTATFSFIVLSAASMPAAISIDLDAGVLRSTLTGGPLVPLNGLLQIVASRSGSVAGFQAPTPGQFITGDNILVASFAMNYNGNPGESINPFVITYENLGAASATKFDAGDPLLLRWYPGLTLASTSPNTGTVYGQLRSDTADGTNLGAGQNAQGITWFGPTDAGQTINVPNGLNYFTTDTTDANGTPGIHATATAFALFTVNPVPEPSTYALLGLGLGGLTFAAMRRRVARAI